MKLVVAIINSDDSQNVLSEITKAGFYATKLSTAGGFLRAGNLTLLIGTENEKVDEILAILHENCKKREAITPVIPSMEGNLIPSVPIKISVGGATVFVLDVEQFYKI